MPGSMSKDLLPSSTSEWEKQRVLCLDIEGGYGGSSRSLFLSLSHIDRQAIEPIVWCKKSGPIQPKYKKIGVSTSVEPDMPRATSLRRFSRNIYIYGKFFLYDWVVSKRFRADLLSKSLDVDIVHFNHEAFFFLAYWLKRKNPNVKISMHIRTNRYGTLFCRWQARMIVKHTDTCVFITAAEKNTLERLSGRPSKGPIIYNIAEPPKAIRSSKVPQDSRLKVLSLSNFAWVRGTDRLIEVAERLKRTKKDGGVLFVMAGNMELSASLPGELGEIGRSGGSLQEYAVVRGVDNMFLFLGHVNDPEAVLLACDALIKPTRENNPWGRDIIEAMTAGKPVISIGECDTFVATQKTGFLHSVYEPSDIANSITELAENPELRVRLGSAGKERALELCNGRSRSNDLLNTWRELCQQET